MKISELQEKLDFIKQEHGDLKCETHADGSISALRWIKVYDGEVHLIDSMGYSDEWNLYFSKRFGEEPK